MKFFSILKYILFLIVATILLTEITAFFFLKSYVRIRHQDERSLSYNHDSDLGWFPQKSSDHQLHGSVPFKVRHNSDGFRDLERSVKRGQRIAFIGDSFVWGYDVAEGERFTDLIDRDSNTFEALNLGVSGYGTDQTYLLLRKFRDKYDLDYVFYIFSPNDRRDNSSNTAYGYLKPYFYKLKDGGFQIRGIPVEQNYLYRTRNLPFPFRYSIFVRLLAKSLDKLYFPEIIVDDPTLEIIREIKRYLSLSDTPFAVGLVESDEEVLTLCEEIKLPCIDLTAPDSSYRFGGYGNHWTPEGHKFIAEKLSVFIGELGWLDDSILVSGGSRAGDILAASISSQLED